MSSEVPNQYDLLNREVVEREAYMRKVYDKSLEVLAEAQLPSGGTVASLRGSRYSGFVYPRDHGYATRAFIVADDQDRAQKAIRYILGCELSPDGTMYQRYNEGGKNVSNKLPQIDGNAQTLLSVAEYIHTFNDSLLTDEYLSHINSLVEGIRSKIQHYPHGNLVFSVNGIIEYSPFEEGYELYTNAVTFRALKETARWYESVDRDTAQGIDIQAERIRTGITNYFYYPEHGGFMSCVRREPNPSLVLSANIKSFLALTDFDLLAPDNERIKKSLEYHLAGTQNADLGGVNRYEHLMDRHNFGNGPWPMVMLRLADYYRKVGDEARFLKCLTWVLNVAQLNLDRPDCLPEHVATTHEFEREYAAFKRMYDIAPREEREREYQTILNSKTYQQLGLAYAVNPLVWSHAQFILLSNQVTK